MRLLSGFFIQDRKKDKGTFISGFDHFFFFFFGTITFFLLSIISLYLHSIIMIITSPPPPQATTLMYSGKSMKSVSLYFGCDSDEKRQAWMDAMKDAINNPNVKKPSPVRAPSPQTTSVPSPSAPAPSPPRFPLERGKFEEDEPQDRPAVIELEDVEHFFESEGEDEAFDVDAPFDEELLGEQEWFNKQGPHSSTPFCSPFDLPAGSPRPISPEVISPSVSPNRGASPAFGPESYRVAAIMRDDQGLIKKSKALVASSNSSSFSLR